MPEAKKPIEGGELTTETKELDRRAFLQAEERAGKEVGEVSDDDIAQILLGDEVEWGDQTRDLRLSAFHDGKSRSS